MILNLLHPTITHLIYIDNIAWYYRTYSLCQEPSEDVKILEKYSNGETDNFSMADNSGFKYWRKWNIDNWSEKDDINITNMIKELFDHGWAVNCYDFY